MIAADQRAAAGGFESGQVLGDHEILSAAGAGGMGVVYKARQRSLNRTVALKVIRDEIAQAPEYHDRFLREARLAASVEHPHVVSVYDVGADENLLWLTMQWVDGHDLRTVIETFGPRAPDRAVAITTQIASALDAVHATGLVHRDVKPANVLIGDVDGKDHAYLTDFGVAKPPDHGADQLTRTGSVVGTTGYLSPEQIRGSEPGPRSDLYALGCVFFEALTGKQPFSGENELAVRWAHANDPRPKISDVRPDLGVRYDAFLARALAVDPKDRFKSGREFAEALDAAHHGSPLVEMPVMPPHAVTAIGPPTPLPPPLTPVPQGAAYPAYAYVTPPPPYAAQSRSGNPLALILLGLVALAGIAVGALAAAGVFSGNSSTTRTITSSLASHKAPVSRKAATSRRKKPSKAAAASGTGASAASSATTACGGGVSVGRDTSCPFAQNVAAAYAQSSGGNTTVAAYSPVTGDVYQMNCTAGATTVCTGGHAAVVYIAGSSASSLAPSTAPSSPTSGNATQACDPNISVNAVTTCPFAENVFKAYADNYQSNGSQSDVSVSANSPATGDSYQMNCTSDGVTVTCTGGSNAFVTFPFHAVVVY